MRRAIGHPCVVVAVYDPAAHAEEPRQETHNAAIIVDVAVDDLIRTMRALQAPEDVKLSHMVPMATALENPRTLTNDFCVVPTRLIVMHQKVHCHAATVYATQHMQEPCFGASAVCGANNLKDSERFVAHCASRRIGAPEQRSAITTQNRYIPQKCPNAGTG
jgi:hypothetical protein